MMDAENQIILDGASATAAPDLQGIRDRLVTAMLPHVLFDGWTGATLANAAGEIGVAPDLAERLFPEGARDLVIHFVRMADRMMIEDMGGIDLTGLGDKGRVMAVVMARLERWSGHREAVKRALAVLALPHNLALALRLTWDTADAVWRAAQKSVHDFSWYTRRASLAAIFGATVLIWLEDDTEDLAQTRGFLSRQLDSVGKAIRARQSLTAKVLPPRLMEKLFG